MAAADQFEALVREGVQLVEANDLHAARDRFSRALVVAESVWGPESEHLIAPLRQLANIEQMSAASPEAVRSQVAFLRRAAGIARAARPPKQAQRAEVLGSLGLSLVRAGRLGEASDVLREAVDDARGVDGSYTRFVLGALIDVLVELTRFDEALAAAQELHALAMAEDLPQVTFEAWYWMGRCLLGVGRASEAIGFLERCVEYRLVKFGESQKNDEFVELLDRARKEARIDSG